MRILFLIALVGGPCFAQNLPSVVPPLSPEQQASHVQEAYNSATYCVAKFASRLAGTSALPQDIADGAMASCEAKIADITSGPYGQSPPNTPLGNWVAKRLHDEAVRVVLDLRFPLTKSKAP